MNADRPTYFPALDGLRCLCAVGVIIAHSYMVKDIWSQTSHPFFPLVTQIGQVGVDIFFCLSGFLITYLLLSERRKYGRVDLKAFYIRRTLRIFPNYYLAVAAAFAVTAVIGASRESFGSLTLNSLLAHLVFLGNWSEAPMLAGPLWSVCIEEQFYLIFPITFVFSRRPHPVFLVALAGVMLSVCVRAVVSWPRIEVYHYTITRTDHLLLGATLAQLFHDDPGRVRAFFRRLGGAGEILAVAALAAFVQTLVWRDATQTGRSISFVVSALICTFLVGQVAFGEGFFSRLLALRVPRALGQLTYATYCFHVFALAPTFVIVKRFGLSPWQAGAARSVIAIPLAFLIAFVCRITYEQRILRLKDRFQPLGRKRAEPLAAGVRLEAALPVASPEGL